MMDFLRMVPIISFSFLVLYKVIKTPTLKGFLNLGNRGRLSQYELFDLILLLGSTYLALRFTFETVFTGTWFEWMQLLVSLALMYRFFYLGIHRIVFLNQSLYETVEIKSFFTKKPQRNKKLI